MVFWINKLKKINESILVFILIFFITSIFLFPAFLGKIDTPLDIRDAQMYPWSYYTVDSKIKTIILWEEEKKNTSILTIPLGESNEIKITPNIQSQAISKAKNVKQGSYYFTVDFNGTNVSQDDLSFEASLLDEQTKVSFKLKIAIVPLFNKKVGSGKLSYRIYSSSRHILEQLLLGEDPNSYTLRLKIKNISKKNNSIFVLQNVKFICEDYAKTLKIHNKYNDDLVQSFTPIREFFSESIKRGKIPFWNNYIFTGIEFINGDPQVGYFHPIYFLSYLIFDHFTAHLFITFICLCFCGIGAYLLSRSWRLGMAASLLTSIVYMFQPYNIFWVSYEHMIMNSMILPFLILFYEKYLKDNIFLNKYLLICASLLGLIMLSGHLQYIYYTFIFFLLFAAFRFIQNCILSKGNYFVHISGIIFIFTIALMIGAIVVIPFIPFMQNSHRVAISTNLMKANSVPLSAFLNLVYPCTFNQISRSYMYYGMLPLLFSIFSFTFMVNRKLTLFFVLTIIFSILICTGSPLFFILKDIVPGFKQLQHHRFLQLFSYCVPFLSGIGFQFAINYFPIFKKRFAISLITMILFISTADLMYHSMQHVTWSKRDDYKPIPKGGSLEYIINQQNKQKEPFRILPFVSKNVGDLFLQTSVAVPNTLLPYKIEDASGYISFIPKDLYSVFLYLYINDPDKLSSKELNQYFPNFNIPYPINKYKSKIIDLLNIKYFLTPDFFILESDNTKEVYRGDCTIYENLNYLPRAFIVPTYKIIESSKDTILKLDSDTFNPRKEVILMMQPEVFDLKLKAKGSMLTNSVKFIKYEQDKIKLAVMTNKAGFLVLGNNLNHNWKVKINGIEGKHYQANLFQRAVYLPKAGEYLVEFYYFSKLFLISASLTLFAIFILVFLAVFLKVKSKF